MNNNNRISQPAGYGLPARRGPGRQYWFISNRTPKCELYLRYIGENSTGLKMQGIFSNLWKVKDNKVIGSQPVDEDGIYNVVEVNYNKGYIWLV